MQVDRIDPAFGNWLAGFMDGEGCFVIGRKLRGDYYSYYCALQLSLRTDDRAILEEIRSTVGFGLLIDEKRRSRARNEKPKSVWIVTRRDDCCHVVDLFRRFPLRAKKARDFEVWAEAVSVWTSRSWYRGWSGPRPEWDEMERLRQRMVEVRSYDFASSPGIAA
jgi:LAGLIDADG endonuclease